MEGRGAQPSTYRAIPPPHKLLPKDLKTGLTKKGGYEGYNWEKVKGNGFILYNHTLLLYIILYINAGSLQRLITNSPFLYNNVIVLSLLLSSLKKNGRDNRWNAVQNWTVFN